MKWYQSFICLVVILLTCFSLLAPWREAQASSPAPSFRWAAVFSYRYDGGVTKTLFIAEVSGPSPDDVASLTATGPGGTFNLVPVWSELQYGLDYAHEENSVVSNGSYTFTVTDNVGRTASVVRDFTYDGTIPNVDSATMSPADQAYVGTTTPTMSFSPVAGGGVYYRVIVWDVDYKAIWYVSPFTQNTSFQVPAGLLGLK